MSGRAVRWVGVALAVGVMAAIVVPDAARQQQIAESQPTVTPSSTPVASPTPAPPQLSRQEINRQDRVSAEHAQRESDAMDGRPLLNHLPIVLGNVAIELSGAGPGGETAEVTVSHENVSRAHAREVYERTLAVYDDPGTAYTVRFVP